MKMVMKPAMPPMHPQRVFSAIGCLLASGFLVLTAGCPADSDVLPDGGGSPDGGGGGVTASFTSLYGDYLGNCRECHAPNAPGRTSDIEQTLDFTSRSTALTSLRGMATGLVGNHTSCNSVPFLASTPADSLLVAVLDQPTRQAIDLSPQHADCDADSISDETVKVGSQPSSAFVTALKTWITNGAMDN